MSRVGQRLITATNGTMKCEQMCKMHGMADKNGAQKLTSDCLKQAGFEKSDVKMEYNMAG